MFRVLRMDLGGDNTKKLFLVILKFLAKFLVIVIARKQVRLCYLSHLEVGHYQNKPKPSDEIKSKKRLNWRVV